MTAHRQVRLELSLPFWRYGAMFDRETCAFLLDSAMDPDRLGRHSFLGGKPAALLTGRRSGRDDLAFDLNLKTWRTPAGEDRVEPDHRTWSGDPFDALRELQETYRPDGGVEGPPGGHFRSGLFGYFGYETGHAVEHLPDTGRDDLQLPDLAFMVCDEVLHHDHVTGETTLAVVDRGDADERTAWWKSRLAEFEQAEAGRAPLPAVSPVVSHPEVHTQFSAEEYRAAVQECRDHIYAGDVFEVCLTQRMDMDLPGDPWVLYAVLKEINPAPFAAWLQLPGFQVVSASPERFLRLDADRLAESRPIKGTRPRGTDEKEDRNLRTELADSAKDRAENVMIVDLVRNDLGKVEIGSVGVPELQVIEKYATVFQMVSTVQARLRPDRDAFDLVRACFPGGSMTGAPKIEAMKIIDALEPVKRGIYSGALGYFDHAGTMDLNIVIRSIVCVEGRAYFGVGGAVVADSDPAAEYQETLDKAKALIEAVGALADAEERS